ncbi:hypothetical protein BH10ACT10_BH10ACT10_18780 [soil metagenome]
MGKFLLVVIVFAALVYATFWLIERRRGGAPSTSRRTPTKPAPRNVAPDDDEDFLRDLNRRQKKRDEGQPPA